MEIIPDARQIVIQIIGFVILFLVLKKFLWKPILDLMAQREKEVQDIYDRAEEVEKKTDDLRADYEGRIANIEDEAQKKLADALKKGQDMAAEIVQQAREESKKEQEKALNAIKEEVKKAHVELRDYVVSLSTTMAEKTLLREVDKSTHEDMTRKFLEELIEKEGKA